MNSFYYRQGRGGRTSKKSSLFAILCPEKENQEVSIRDCFDCAKYGPWGKDFGDTLNRCHYEFTDLLQRGFFDGSWDQHEENFSSDDWQNLSAEKENSKRVKESLDAEWDALEPRREEIKKDLDRMHEVEKRMRRRIERDGEETRPDASTSDREDEGTEDEDENDEI